MSSATDNARRRRPRQRRAHTPASTQQQATPRALALLAPGVSLTGLSRLTGISVPTLSRVANHKRGLSVKTARRIARALDLPVGRVLDVLQPIA